MAEWKEAIITERIDWTEGLASLRFHSDLAPYKAGQYATIALDIDGKRIARPFSYSSSPDEDFYEIYLVAVPEGALSPHLYQLQTDHRLWVMTNAHGFFTLDEIQDAECLWLIATGTGLAPYLSMLKTATPWTRFKNIILVHGVRKPNELTYTDLIHTFESDHPGQFVFVPFISREKTEYALEGRIPAAIADGRLEFRANSPLKADNSQVMLCGNPDMVKEAVDILKTRDFSKNLRRSPGNITTEKYW